MRISRFSAVLLILALAGCAEADAPVAPEATSPEAVKAEGPREVVPFKPATFRGGTPLVPTVPNCQQGSVGCGGVYVGTTLLFGWLVPGAGDALDRKTGLSGFGFVLTDDGPSDTIPVPPSPLRHFRKNSEMARQYGQVLSLAGLEGSDTIPVPPAPMVLNVDGDALFLFGVDDLVVKGILAPADDDGASVSMLWSEQKGRLGTQLFQADGDFPPSDTIPPAPELTEPGGE